jgi:hypothetical protein
LRAGKKIVTRAGQVWAGRCRRRVTVRASDPNTPRRWRSREHLEHSGCDVPLPGTLRLRRSFTWNTQVATFLSDVPRDKKHQTVKAFPKITLQVISPTQDVFYFELVLFFFHVLRHHFRSVGPGVMCSLFFLRNRSQEGYEPLLQFIYTLLIKR